MGWDRERPPTTEAAPDVRRIGATGIDRAPRVQPLAAVPGKVHGVASRSVLVARLSWGQAIVLSTIIIGSVAIAIGYLRVNRRSYWRMAVIAVVLHALMVYLASIGGRVEESPPDSRVLDGRDGRDQWLAAIWHLALFIAAWATPAWLLVRGARRSRFPN